MGCCRDICWCRCPCLPALILRRDVKYWRCTWTWRVAKLCPEFYVRRTRSHFTCSETSILPVIKKLSTLLDFWAANLPWVMWTFHIREVLLHVKRVRVRVTSHSGAQVLCTSRSCTLLGFASHHKVGTDKQGHRDQHLARQQPVKCIRKQKADAHYLVIF